MKKLIFTLAATAFFFGAQVEQVSAATITPVTNDQISPGNGVSQQGKASFSYDERRHSLTVKVITGGKKERATLYVTSGHKTYIKEVFTATNRPMEFTFDLESLPSGVFDVQIVSQSISAQSRIQR